MSSIERLIALKSSKSKYANGGVLATAISSDEGLKSEIRYLASVFIKEPLGNCESCLMDAYVVLTKLNIDTAMQIIQSKFELKAGVLLHRGEPQSKWMSCKNTTDELALYHLRKHPEYIQKFARVPANLSELLAPVVEPTPAPEPEPAPAEEGKEEVLTAEAVASMSFDELRKAASARGIKVVGVKADDIRAELISKL